MTIGVDLEKTNALKDASDIIKERGQTLIIRAIKESNLNRDIYNSIKKKTLSSIDSFGVSFFTFPVNYSPTKFQLEKAGIKENVDVLVTLSMLDFTNSALSYKDIDSLRWEILLDEEVFLVSDKNRVNHFSNTFLNIVLGLLKK